jgi:hypothetical protein
MLQYKVWEDVRMVLATGKEKVTGCMMRVKVVCEGLGENDTKEKKQMTSQNSARSVDSQGEWLFL